MGTMHNKATVFFFFFFNNLTIYYEKGVKSTLYGKG